MWVSSVCCIIMYSLLFKKNNDSRIWVVHEKGHLKKALWFKTDGWDGDATTDDEGHTESRAKRHPLPNKVSELFVAIKLCKYFSGVPCIVIHNNNNTQWHNVVMKNTTVYENIVLHSSCNHCRQQLQHYGRHMMSCMYSMNTLRDVNRGY